MFLVDRKDILMKRSKKRKHAWCCDMRTLMGILILCLLSFTVPGILENKEEQLMKAKPICQMREAQRVPVSQIRTVFRTIQEKTISF